MKGKREQDEAGPKEITPADRVRAAHAKREQDEAGPKEITPADTFGPVPAKHVMKKFGVFVTSLVAAIIVYAVYGIVSTVFLRAFPNIGMPGLIIALILMVGLMIAAALLTYRTMNKKNRVRALDAKREQDESPATSNGVDASGDAELQDASGDAEPQVAEFYAQLKRVTPYAFVTPALVLINVSVFAAMIAAGVDLMSPSIEHLLSWGANYAPMTTGGEWWRLLTSNYLHIGIIHIAFNMWVLWDAGRLVERLLGNIGFIVMYVLSGVFGSFTSVLWNPTVVSAGASGAVFGVYGCLIGFLLLSRGSIPNKVLKGISSSALAFIAYNVFYAIGEEGIDMAAHVGGLATGFLCGVIMRLPLASGSAGRRWVGNWIVGGIGAAVIALAIGNGLGQPVGVQAALFRFGEVEARVLAKFDDTMQKAQWGALSDARVSLILDEEIVIPWRAARVEFETIDDVPIRDKPRFDKLVAYMNLRENAWRLLSVAIKAGDEEMANSFADKMQEVEQILAELEEME